MQLSQIVIYKKRQKFDFTFKKVMDINLLDEKIVKDNLGIPTGLEQANNTNIFKILEGNQGLSKLSFDNDKIKQIAFLKQKNVFKNINVIDNSIKVIFAFCDQDL